MRNDVVVEEVAVDGSLDGTSNPDNPITVTNFSKEAVDPVDEVHSTVATQAEDVVRSEILNETTRLLCKLVNNDQLRNNGDSFQVDGERPQDLSEGEVFIDEQGQNCAGDQEVREEESIILLVISVAPRALKFHQIDNEDSSSDEDDFHDRVVQGHKVVEEIEVTGNEDEGI